jgi:hypothetical protein
MMANLKKEYLDSFPQKIAVIDEHFKAKNIELLRDDFHKLKGTGKTYGMPEVSVLGEVVERVCKEKTSLALNIVPLAISTLQKIVEAHSKKSVYDIQQDPDFKSIVAQAR